MHRPLAPDGDERPRGQATHGVAALESASDIPGTHCAQTVRTLELLPDAYVPLAQVWQGDAEFISVSALPMMHVLHVVDFVPAYLPIWHGTHTVSERLSVSALPAAHSVQAVAAAAA
jgi:hypothetical protein